MIDMRSRYNLYIALLILSMVMLAALPLRSAAARPDFIFEHYSSEDGLPHNSITQIHQDAKGYIWTCTWYGLSRFDGNSFVNYTMMPGDYVNLSHNRIMSIDEDVNGYLWLTSYDYHLYRFDPSEETFASIQDEAEGFPETSQKVSLKLLDSKGNAWVEIPGTGLCRISPDLVVTDTFGSERTVITAVFEAPDGSIFVTSESGLHRLKESAVTTVSRIPDFFASACLDGKLFFLSRNVLISLSPDASIVSRIDLSACASGLATSMTVTGSGESSRLCIGFSQGAVGVLDSKSDRIEVSKGNIGEITALFPDSQGLLWVVTDRPGICSFDYHTGNFKHHLHSRNVMSYYRDNNAKVVEKDGMVWVKMNEWGFGYYDRERGEIVPLDNVKELPQCRFMNGVACFEVDRTGVLWMSTAQRGLERITAITQKVDVVVPPTQSEDIRSASEIRAILQDSRGYVWIANKSREIFRYDADLKHCRRFPDRISGDIGGVYCVFEDNAGNIWLGTKGDGLVRMTPHPQDDTYSYKRFKSDPDKSTSLSSDNIYSITQDLDGRIWIGTFGGGISMLPNPDAEDFVTIYNDFPDYPEEFGDRVRYVHCTPDGKMLVATVGGLIWFTPSDNTQRTVFHFVHKIPGDIRSLGNNDIIHIFTDRRGCTWLCTFGGGLNRMTFSDGNPRFDVVSEKDGLVSNIVLSAVDDEKGDIWMATERGLCKYDFVSGSITNYTRYDGIVPTSFSEATCTRLSDGRLLFGTVNNVYCVEPSHFAYTPADPMLAITGFRLGDKRIPYEGKVVVPYDCSFFRVDFASLNFTIKGKINYSYKLEGYDKDWISAVDNRSVVYSRIPAGNYVFKVSAAAAEGMADRQTVSLAIRVKPSFWASWPMVLLYCVAALLLIAFLLRLLVTSVKLRNDVKLEQDLNKMKMRFFTNISHELRTPLTLILGGIDEVSKNTAEGDKTEYGVNLVYKNARRMLTLVNQLLDIRRIVDGKLHLKVKQIDIVALLKDVYDDFRDMAAERQMEMRLTHSVDSLMVWGDAMRLEALIYNLLSNAFKYTSDGGMIEAAIFWREGEKEYTIMVKDNGIGVSKDKQKAIFEPFIQATDAVFKGMGSSGIGLSFCKEIAEIHGGRIWVESVKNEGATFYVRLPLGREHFTPDIAEFLNEESKAVPSFGLSKYKVEPTYPEVASKILVVEDNAELKVYIYNNLVNQYEVRDASNGREALDVISSGWMPDMIVTDLMMPELDGIGLINHIRNDFNTSHIPIIVITARHEDDTHLKAMKYGADGYIAKPFTMELLLVKIENLFQRRKQLATMIGQAREQEDDNKSGKQGGKVNLSPEEIVITDRDEELLRKVSKWLEDNIADSEVTVEQLAVYVGMGRTSMYNKIKGLTGKSPVELIQEYRLEKATYYLKSGQFSVSETSYKVGFSDPGYFSRSFKKHFGMSPADYMKQNRQ